MAKMFARPKIEAEIVLIISEAEARALAELASYKTEDVVEAIGEKISTGIIRDHGPALREFLKSVSSEVADPLRRLDEARKVFSGMYVAEPNAKIATQQQKVPADQCLPGFRQ